MEVRRGWARSLRATSLAILLACVCSWQRWAENTRTTETDPTKYTSPGARRGHSLVLRDDPEMGLAAGDGVHGCIPWTPSGYGAGWTPGKECRKQTVVLFGGRSEDKQRPHVPKTYRIEEVNGTLEFATYENKRVNDDDDATGFVPSGLYFNDVWEYDLDCARTADKKCDLKLDRTSEWTPLADFAKDGGCRIVQGEEICTTPSERWLHGAAAFRNEELNAEGIVSAIKGDMLIYGGFSHRCEDYCDDMWRFNFEDRSWTEVVQLGRLRGTYETQRGFGPGKRTRFSVANEGMVMVVFGGFRLWHGFLDHNSQDNDWSGDGLVFNMRWHPGGGEEPRAGQAVCIKDGWRLNVDGTKLVLMDANTRDNMELATRTGRIEFANEDLFVRARPSVSSDVWIEGHIRRTPASDGWELQYEQTTRSASGTSTATVLRTFRDEGGSVMREVENGQLELLNELAQSEFLSRTKALSQTEAASIGAQKRLRRRLGVVDPWVAGVATKTATGWATVFDDGTTSVFRDASARLSLAAHIEAGKVEISSRPVVPPELRYFAPVDGLQLVSLATLLMPRSRGGYLDDVWTYNKTAETWRSYRKQQVCESDYVKDKDAWEDRNRQKCTVSWPSGRAGHVAVLDATGTHMYIHGGYRSFFPYPTSGGAGAEAGIASAGQPGFAPYPQHPVYMDDMWRFDLSTGLWEQLHPFSESNPAARLDHVMVRANDMFIMFGGLANNFYFGDTWLYNVTSNHWVQKKEMVHARYPPSCTDDLRHRQTYNDYDTGYIACMKEVGRCYSADGVWQGPPDPNATAQGVNAFGTQLSATHKNGWRFLFHHCRGAVECQHCRPGSPKETKKECEYCLQNWAESKCMQGTGDPEGNNYMPDDVNLPLEKFVFNWTDNADQPLVGEFVYERFKEYYYNDGNHYGCCTETFATFEDKQDDSRKWTTKHNFSVVAEPTRKNNGVVILDAYKDKNVLIYQARRQAPGWDGCRDRDDNRTDLPNELQWLQPTQRAGHAAIWSPGTRQREKQSGQIGNTGEYEPNDFMIVYGGHGFEEDQLERYDRTPKAQTLSDMWMFRIHDCPKNCSLHGMCRYGTCFCDDGYYGVDCSNSSCPGDFCYYDTLGKQHCKHCCSATYEQKNVAGDGVPTWLYDERKIPCSLQHPGESHGVCDGFGKCLCAPPFIGADCSVRDCMHNCSGHGDCGVEFPNARCVCDEGWTGKVCDYQTCVNNCSYPNGVCVNGTCFCAMTYSPFNRTRQYWPWMGDDCSWRLPYAAGGAVRPNVWVQALVVSGLALLLAADGLVDGFQPDDKATQ